MKTLWEGMAKAAGRVPPKPALVERGLTLTYPELLAATAAMGDFLTEAGLGPGETAAVQMPNSVDCVVCALGVVRTGAGLMVLDAALKPQEVARCCGIARAGMLLVDPAGQAEAPQDGPPLLAAPRARELKAATADHGAPPEAGEGPYLLLSSGTTGAPKVVHRESRHMEAAVRIHAAGLGYGPDDRTLAVLPFCHSFGLGNVLLGTLARGGTLFLEAFSPRSTAATIERERITVLPGTPFMFRALAQTAFRRRPDFSSVRCAVSAGSALSPAIAVGFAEAYGIRIAQCYGTTETGPVTLARSVHDVPAGWLGKPEPGVEVRILDDGRPLGRGLSGQVAVLSPANATGYLSEPELTAAKFRDGCFLTGDVGRVDADGDLFVTGRVKPMVSVDGKKVSPAEVEACLRAHPRVAEALVVAGGDRREGEWVKALVVPLREVTAMELREHCGQNLAAFKVPRQIVFVDDLSSGPMQKPSAAASAGD